MTAPRATACPTCTRRLKPDDAGRYCCQRCGTTGQAMAGGDGVFWKAGGDGSVESRRARASWKQDGLAQMKRSGASVLPGMEGS